MSTRRKFLCNGSLAAAAVLVAKPFNGFANTVSPLTGFSVNNHKIVLLHTANYNPGYQYLAAQEIKDLKRAGNNLLILHTGDTAAETAAGMHFDSVLEPTNCASISSTNYKIIYKDNIKTGIITAAAGEQDIMHKIEALAIMLKKEKNCDLVICLSQLGFKNKTAIDDIHMAENSTALDIIIGGHPSNYTRHARTAQNKNKYEVIIHSSADEGFALGSIEIGFDDARNKNSVALNNLLTRITPDS